jgi:hypothetical protein
MASSLNQSRKATERAIKDGIRLFVAAGKALSSVAGVCPRVLHPLPAYFKPKA